MNATNETNGKCNGNGADSKDERSAEKADATRELRTLVDGLFAIAQKPCLCGHVYQRFARAGRRQRDGSWFHAQNIDSADKCPKCDRPNIFVSVLARVTEQDKRKVIMRALIERLPQPTASQPGSEPSAKPAKPAATATPSPRRYRGLR